jgi:hypothetical protein
VVVFMTFWQGIAITGMSVLGLVDEQSGMAAQNILICIEMLLASLMHHLFFPYREWQEVRIASHRIEHRHIHTTDTS